MCLFGGYQWTAWIFIGVWYINLLVERLLLVFLFLEGEWPEIFNICFARLFSTSAQNSLGMRQYHCASTTFEFPDGITWQSVGVNWFPFPGFFSLLWWHFFGVLDLILPFWCNPLRQSILMTLWTTWPWTIRLRQIVYPHPLHWIGNWRDTWPAQCAWRTHKAWFYCRRYFFRLSDQMSVRGPVELPSFLSLTGRYFWSFYCSVSSDDNRSFINDVDS